MDEITAILEHVTGEVRKKFQEMSDGGSIKDSILAFVHAVDWTVRQPQVLCSADCLMQCPASDHWVPFSFLAPFLILIDAIGGALWSFALR